MTWPSSDVNTTGMDAGTDTPPRAEFLSWAQKFNQLRNHVSAFMQGLLTSADAAAVRSTLSVPTRTGGDASGTWPIGISGNAATVTNGVTTVGNQSIAGDKTFTGATTFSNPRVYQTASSIGFEMGPGAGTGDANKQGFFVPAGKSLYLGGNGGLASMELGPSGVIFTGLTLSTSAVNSATAGSVVGGIGTYAILFSTSSVTYDANYAGSSLRAQGIGRAADSVLVTPNGTGSLQTGTWKCLGSFSSVNGGLALFLRIS